MSPDKVTPHASSSTSSGLPSRGKRAGFLPPRMTALALGATLSLAALGSLTSSNRSYCHTTPQHGKEESLGRWIEKESRVAWWGVLENIGPQAGAKPGLVIASPSRSHPDYFYTWTRDSAITFGTIFDRFAPANTTSANHADTSLEPLFREYVQSQRELQLVKTPSGGFNDGGLGEPKYNVDGTAFTGSWGRPQRDGPPLRAMVISRYASYLLDRDSPADKAYIASTLYDSSKLASPGSVLKSDLEYVAHNWDKDGFDLWEEISSPHFFTLLTSHRALTLGAALATRLHDQGASDYYLSQAELIEQKLEKFWLEDKGYIQASLPSSKFKRTGLDSAVVLAVLKAGGEGQEKWGVAGERMLATVEKYVAGFKDLYKVNEGGKRNEWNGALAVGRYAEDIYDGDGTSLANPWYICTFAVAELAFKILTHHLQHPSITPTPLSLPFWAQFSPFLSAHATYSPSSHPETFFALMDNLELWADGFLQVGRTFQGEDGALSEQFSKDDGTPRGATHLTWSYGAFLDAVGARRAFHHAKRDAHRRHQRPNPRVGAA